MSRKVSVKCAISGCHRRLKMTPEEREELRRVGRDHSAEAGIVCPRHMKAAFDFEYEDIDIDVPLDDGRRHAKRPVIRNGNVLEEIVSPRAMATRRRAGHFMGMARDAMNPQGRNGRPTGAWLAYAPSLPTGIHLVRTGGNNPESHQPAPSPDAGLDHVDSLLAPRRDGRPPEVMGQPEIQSCRHDGDRLMGQPEVAANL